MKLECLSTFTHHLERQEDVMVELLSQDFEDEWRYAESRNAVAVTWLISFHQIQRLNPLAADYVSIIHVMYRSPGYPPVTSSTGLFQGPATKCIGSSKGLFIHYRTSKRPSCKSSPTCSFIDKKLAAKWRDA